MLLGIQFIGDEEISEEPTEAVTKCKPVVLIYYQIKQLTFATK